MADIQSLIKMLQSDNTNERRAACNELRVLPSLPQEGLQALRVATNDKNPSVAEAAQRALVTHAEMNKVLMPSEKDKRLYSILAMIFAAIAGFIAFLLTVWLPANYYDSRVNAQHPGAGAGATLVAFFLGTPLACLMGPLVGVLGAVTARRFAGQSPFLRSLPGPVAGALAGFISAAILDLIVVILAAQS